MLLNKLLFFNSQLNFNFIFTFTQELENMAGINACAQLHVYHQKVRAIVIDGTVVCADNYVPNSQLKIELGKFF